MKIQSIIISSALGLIIVIAAGMYIFPQYNVWHQKLAGEAEFSRAEQNRRIKVLEAEAKKESATLEGDAEAARAEGVAKANAIIGAGLKGNEEYLRYLWIKNLENAQGQQVIYVPTEAGLPLLEAGKRP